MRSFASRPPLSVTLSLAGLLLFAAATGRAAESSSLLPEEGDPLSVGSWAAGLEAVSVGLPSSMVASDANTDPPPDEAPVERQKRGEFFAVPIPRVDPALGNGLVGAAAYIFKLNKEDEKSPPSLIGAGAMWMDSGSWGGGLGGKLYFNEDRFRLMSGLVYADLRYDLTATTMTGEEATLPLAQEAYGGLAHAQFAVARHSYLGVRMQLGKLSTAAEIDLPPSLSSIQDDLGVVFQVNSLGPTFAFDTRDNSYYPRSGIAFDANADVYFSGIGSEVSFTSYTLNYRQYMKVRERDVFAWQAYGCAAGGDPPFFLQCQVGPMSILRGYSFGKYRGDAMAAAQAEYRWQVRPRWIVAAFGGVAQAAERFGDLNVDDNLYAGGVGVRFVVEPKNGVTLRVDYGVGKDEGAWYVSVGEAF